MSINTPQQIPAIMEQNGINKANMGFRRLVILAIMAGAFIGLGAMGASAAAHAFTSPAVQKLVSSVVFPTGLIMVMLCGAELFTGDCLVVVSCLQKKVKWRQFLRLLAIVWLFNFVGGALVALLTYLTPQWSANGGLLGAYTLKIAADKTAIDLGSAFFSGILCNIMVCLAIWTATASPTAAGKVICCLFPMIVFIEGGFEHCVANMYYITAGLLAKANPNYVAVALNTLNLSQEKLEGLTIANFLIRLVPVTIGNILGGAVFVGGAYTIAYLK